MMIFSTLFITACLSLAGFVSYWCLAAAVARERDASIAAAAAAAALAKRRRTSCSSSHLVRGGSNITGENTHAHSRTHHYPPIMYAYLTISSPHPIRVIIIIIEYFYFFD